MVDDKRPRLYGKTATKRGEIELTVQGAEGETAEELSGIFSAKLCELIEAQEAVGNDDVDDSHVQ